MPIAQPRSHHDRFGILGRLLHRVKRVWKIYRVDHLPGQSEVRLRWTVDYLKAFMARDLIFQINHELVIDAGVASWIGKSTYVDGMRRGWQIGPRGAELIAASRER